MSLGWPGMRVIKVFSSFDDYHFWYYSADKARLRIANLSEFKRNLITSPFSIITSPFSIITSPFSIINFF